MVLSYNYCENNFGFVVCFGGTSLAKPTRKTDGWKSKQWYSVISPEVLGTVNVGETVTNDPDNLVGRVIETTLGDVVKDFAKQNIKLKLKIARIGGDSAYTKFMGHQMTQDYLRSLVKRRSSTIDSNIDVVTSDGYKVRVKPSCFTIKRAHLTQIHGLRKLMNQVIRDHAKQHNFDQFLQEILNGKLSAMIYKEAKKIYPLRRVEIRKTEVKGEPSA
jgi:small subunit ribosomal protein S3Ae